MSMVEPAPTSVLEEPDATFYRLVQRGSIKRKDKVFDNHGYSYVYKNGSELWVCPTRNKETLYCPARLTKKNSLFQSGGKDHAHLPLERAATISATMKDAAAKNPFTSVAVIVETCIEEQLGRAPCDALPRMDFLTHTANRHRHKPRPPESKDLTFDVDTDHFQPEFNLKDVTVRDRRHLVFGTDRQLDILGSGKTWYMDATFKVVRPPFTQLFSVHAFIRQDHVAKQVPLCFAMMSGKKRRDYQSSLGQYWSCFHLMLECRKSWSTSGTPSGEQQKLYYLQLRSWDVHSISDRPCGERLGKRLTQTQHRIQHQTRH